MLSPFQAWKAAIWIKPRLLCSEKKIWILRFPFMLRNSFLHSNTRCNLFYSVRLTAVIGLEIKKKSWIKTPHITRLLFKKRFVLCYGNGAHYIFADNSITISVILCTLLKLKPFDIWKFQDFKSEIKTIEIRLVNRISAFQCTILTFYLE